MSVGDSRIASRSLATSGLAVAAMHFSALAVLFVLSRLVFAEEIPDVTSVMSPAALALDAGAKYAFLPLVATFWISAALALIAARDPRVRVVRVAITFVLLAGAVPLAVLSYGVWGAMVW